MQPVLIFATFAAAAVDVNHGVTALSFNPRLNLSPLSLTLFLFLPLGRTRVFCSSGYIERGW